MKILTITKYIDQPLVVNKIYESAPKLLGGVSLVLGIKDTFFKKDNESKSKKFVKNLVILTAVSTAALISSRGLRVNGKKIFNGLINLPSKNEVLVERKQAINDFISLNKTIDAKIVEILNKGKEQAFSLKDTGFLLDNLSKNKKAKNLMLTLFGKKDDMSSKQIFSEIGRLSLLGFVPVATGVMAGMAVDFSKNKKQNNSNRVKEGFYQYFANIFLCNIGAGTALFGLEALKRKSIIKQVTPTTKFFSMIGGILATGVIGGSFIANYLSKKIIDPLLLGKHESNLTFKKIYDERTPESIDLAMHIDDVATAGVLSGLKWIEPILPVFYLVSGYRAGIGYRNQDKTN